MLLKSPVIAKMFRYLFVLPIILAIAYGQYSTRIVGGFVTSINRFPFQVSLRDSSNQHFCGGSIVSKFTILTAAHCVKRLQKNELTVVAGATFLNQGGVRRNIVKITIHPQYDSRTFNWDAAILILDNALPLSATVAVIPLRTTEVSAGTISTASGWGYTSESGSISNQLRAVSVPIIARATCIRNYAPQVVTPIMICAGYVRGGKDSCQADSGGPLVTTVGSTRQLAGIVSWGEGCARPNKPGVYANVPKLRAWIQTNTA